MTDPNIVARAIVSAAFRISKALGPGLLESVYERVLERDLVRQGLHVERQKPVSFGFEGLWFENGFRVDLVVEKMVIVELKSARALDPADHKQLLTYPRLTDCKLGLLINFGAPTLRSGIKRVVNGL